jgi:hypothetical protein
VWSKSGPAWTGSRSSRRRWLTIPALSEHSSPIEVERFARYRLELEAFEVPLQYVVNPVLDPRMSPYERDLHLKPYRDLPPGVPRTESGSLGAGRFVLQIFNPHPFPAQVRVSLTLEKSSRER